MGERKHIVVAGAGGNTGSQLVPHLARMPGIGKLTLVDPQAYEGANLAVQNIERGDVGKRKVHVQAAKALAISPGLDVAAFELRIEDVPRGRLRSDLMVSCLDSKSGRQSLNEIAYRLGVPWVDCGVLGWQNLARVNCYVPAMDAVCIECPWGAEYALLEQEYLCGADSGSAHPTLASSALGALAASLAALEAAKLLAGDFSTAAVGRQVLVNGARHSLTVTGYRRNPQCRFDHRTWTIAPWKCRMENTTVGEVLDAQGSLKVEGHRFVPALACPQCGRQEKGLRLNRPLARCVDCGRRMATPGFDARDHLDANLKPEYRALTLAQVGLCAGDVVTLGGEHFQLEDTA